MAETDKVPNRVVFIHGIRTIEAPSDLLKGWNRALFGRESIGDTGFAYWADITNDELPEYGVVSRQPASRSETAQELAFSADVMRQWESKVTDLNARRMGTAWRIPGLIANPLTWMGSQLLPDVRAYFYNEELREKIHERVLRHLHPDNGPYMLVGHSLGSVIAYVLLKQIEQGHYPEYKSVNVTHLITLGSPLGVVNAYMKKLLKNKVVPKTLLEWHNFSDPIDPVAADGTVEGDYTWKDTDTIVEDHNNVVNGRRFSGMFGAHSAEGYLEFSEVRKVTWRILGPRFRDQLTRDRVARDLRLEANDLLGQEISEVSAAPMLPVLIELSREAGDRKTPGALDGSRDSIVKVLKKWEKQGQAEKIDVTTRYVAARIDPRCLGELELASGNVVHRIWRNAVKRAYMKSSARTLQADAGRMGYGAEGEGVSWAVLDTGIRQSHGHFKLQKNIVEVLDCTVPNGGQSGRPVPVKNAKDSNGHGTHVAGIIAGVDPVGGYTGLAPKAQLHIYKVLDDEGFGDDMYILKALQDIYQQNEIADGLVVHGVNLSLGGPFDPEVYACGHSPICKELRRLWRQGVLVCVAAGNEGQYTVLSSNGYVSLTNDLSIGDPANLEECIAVGSINGEYPFRYGTSYFSSRGPTADGRCKPDVVAPGERVWSCDARTTTGYIEMSGTSMACPAVSGMLAAFLSARREFIGRPDEVKKLLMECCTDLGRDRYHQGAGMPNIVKMLVST